MDEHYEQDGLGNGLEVGFSKRIDTEEFREAMAQANRTYVLTVAGTALLLPPFLGLIAYVLMRPIKVSLVIAACLIVEVIILAIVANLLLRRFAGKGWDGEVTNKHVGLERSGKRRMNPVYIIEFVTDDGKKRKHKERTLHPSYDYLQVGDRVRYHPQLSYPFEKFDKTRDVLLLCPFCGSSQSPAADYCTNCRKPLLK